MMHALYQGTRDLALVLEKVPAGDLQQFLQRHGALSERAVNAIMVQLADALAHVHSCGGTAPPSQWPSP
jgi:serine/threonine protein kinase